MKDAKEKTDKIYRHLKDTINKSLDLQNQLEDCRNLIKFQEKKTEDLKISLEVHKETLLRNDDYIEAALNEQTRRREINQAEIKKMRELLEVTRNEAYRQKAEKLEDEETSWMCLEDTTAKLLRIQQKCKESLEKNNYLREQKAKACALSEQDVVVNRALAKSKPMVTEIMEYFNQKESENSNKEERIETLVEGLQFAIEECLISEQKFQKAAYYDANKFFQFERTQRSAYTEN